jgi:hypothetical protein
VAIAFGNMVPKAAGRMAEDTGSPLMGGVNHVVSGLAGLMTAGIAPASSIGFS